MPASGACWIANTAYSGCQRFVAFVLKQSARRAVFVRQGALPRQVRPGTRSTRICTLGILARLNHKHALCSQQHSLRLSLEQSPPWRRPRRGCHLPLGLSATACSPPQALGPVGVVCGRACVLTSFPLHQQADTWCSDLARPRAPALQCLDVFLRAGELPRRLVFSCVCAGMVPVAPAVGAVLVCACCTGGTQRGLMCVWYLR